jgi:hypothetical protein
VLSSFAEQGVDAAGETKLLPKKGGWEWAEIAQDCDEFIKVAQEFWWVCLLGWVGARECSA